MKYKVKYQKSALKQLKKIDHSHQTIIVKWIEKNLSDTENPRKLGKKLQGNFKSFWRYRVGKYRIIATISDNDIIINIVDIGHRSNIYK